MGSTREWYPELSPHLRSNLTPELRLLFFGEFIFGHAERFYSVWAHPRVHVLGQVIVSRRS